jgi:hypothetical protein
MIRAHHRSRALALAILLVGGGTPLAARAQTDAGPVDAGPNRLGVAFATGLGGSPLGHVGLELRGEHGRLEGAVGVGVFIGDLCQSESHPPIEQCAHPVVSVALRYAALRRGHFDLAPGLGLSLQPAHQSQQLTRPAYGTIDWDWRWGQLSPRLNADVEALYRPGPWFYGVVAGAGVMIAEASTCTATNMGNLWNCSNVPSPAYAAPTPFAVTGYGQIVIGRVF